MPEAAAGSCPVWKQKSGGRNNSLIPTLTSLAKPHGTPTLFIFCPPKDGQFPKLLTSEIFQLSHATPPWRAGPRDRSEEKALCSTARPFFRMVVNQMTHDLFHPHKLKVDHHAADRGVGFARFSVVIAGVNAVTKTGVGDNTVGDKSGMVFAVQGLIAAECEPRLPKSVSS